MNHMAWVTHGKAPLGKCPLDARCICELCWEELKQHGQPLPVHGALPPPRTVCEICWNGVAWIGLYCQLSCWPSLRICATRVRRYSKGSFVRLMSMQLSEDLLHWKCAGRKPTKSASFYGNTIQGREPGSSSRVESLVKSPVLVSPRSPGSDDMNRGNIHSPQPARDDAEQIGQPGTDPKVTGQTGKVRPRLKWPFKRK